MVTDIISSPCYSINMGLSAKEGNISAASGKSPSPKSSTVTLAEGNVKEEQRVCYSSPAW
ncbi:hypothetical protein SCFA_1420003 [anaerobic digester metagenome]|uniref:Uncharacterized protein n=1 Tax=anaerobic digester metagenome TaxID=1263854 RepID=A0A485LWI0_9ZZZZ